MSFFAEVKRHSARLGYKAALPPLIPQPPGRARCRAGRIDLQAQTLQASGAEQYALKLTALLKDQERANDQAHKEDIEQATVTWRRLQGAMLEDAVERLKDKTTQAARPDHEASP